MTIALIREQFREGLSELYASREVDSIFYLLMEHYGKINRLFALSEEGFKIPPQLREQMVHALAELKTGRPVQYITGEAFFCGLSLKVNPHVLIPRPETEELVRLIAEENKYISAPVILDIGTGSGCIALALKREFPLSRVVATDNSSQALAVATDNAAGSGLDITFVMDDILNPAFTGFSPDIIVSNPPYVTLSEKGKMHPNVLNYEPENALFVGNDKPFIFYEAILDFAIRVKNRPIKIYFEVNQYLAVQLCEVFSAKGYASHLYSDFKENHRFIRLIIE